MFAFQDTVGPVEVAFTDRHAADGGGPSAALDLSAHPRDDAHRAEVQRSFAMLRAAMASGAADAGGRPRGVSPPPRLVSMRQVHGADVALVDATALDRDDIPECDALVTRLPGVALVVRVADCVPVLLADAQAGVVAAVHAGRVGLAAGVVPAAIAAMRTLGAGRLQGWVGPHVCGGCYEVPEQMRSEVSDSVPAAWSTTSWGTPALDIGAGVRTQLLEEAVEVVDASRCTVESEDLYSYRRQGAASGRLGGLIWVRP
ncbi:MAG TPA: polyphenol oxidase family protein [Nocardioidaceae bacterium]|nr:polyphenol oxidase family protein [Nocardioidaceae bacterium]